MAKFSAELNPTVALDAIAGEATGELLTFMGMGSTVIVYGLLSFQNSSNIDPIYLMGRDQKIEGFLLTHAFARKTPEALMAMMGKCIQLYKTHVNTEIHKRLGFDKIEEAREYYSKNATKGKVILKPSLFGKDSE